MVPRLAGTFALLFAATALLAQNGKKVRIEFAGEGNREVWIQAKGKEGTVAEKRSVSGKAVDVEVPADVRAFFAYVHDKATGNVATKRLQDFHEKGVWSVTAKDETHAYLLAFKLEHEGEPVATAVVHLRSGKDERETLVTDADNGVASFFVVPYGDVEVTVDYKSGGKDASLGSQVFEARPGMSDAVPAVLTIDDEVETVAPPQTEKPDVGTEGEEGSDATKEEPPRASPFLTFFNMLIGLLVIVGVTYGIWRYVKANSDQTANALRKAGVHVPGGPADPGFSQKKAGPPQQIILADAAPTTAGPAIAAGPVVKNPRLVRSDGSLYIVQDGEQVAGRDADNELALTAESSVSRRHAKLSKAGDAVTVEDMGSTNGTFVNGQRLTSPTNLNAGDTVQFGAVQYRYEE